MESYYRGECSRLRRDDHSQPAEAVMGDFLQYVSDRREVLEPQFFTQLKIVATSLLFATLIGVTLGVLASRSERFSAAVTSVASALLTIPSFAMFGILAIWLGIGDQPVRIGLVLYALLPILRNTETGIRAVDPSILEAARGMGMSSRQLLLRVELPLAMPLAVAGIRQSAVLIVAIATVGAAVGSNNLGQPIFAGIRGSDRYAVLSGALPVAALGLFLDGDLLLIENLIARGRSFGEARSTA